MYVQHLELVWLRERRIRRKEVKRIWGFKLLNIGHVFNKVLIDE
jgi:hypothetical protein